MLLVILAAVSSMAFFCYGAETLFGVRPRREFERYGMPQVRVFVGSMQLLGAAGVAIGLVIAPIGAAAATGLTVMMLLGLIARYRIHDALRLMVPAGSLAILNAVLVYLFATQ